MSTSKKGINMFYLLAFSRILDAEYIEFLGPLHGRYALAVNRWWLLKQREDLL